MSTKEIRRLQKILREEQDMMLEAYYSMVQGLCKGILAEPTNIASPLLPIPKVTKVDRELLSCNQRVNKLGIIALQTKLLESGWYSNVGNIDEERDEIDIKGARGHARIEIQLKTSSRLTSKSHRNHWCFNVKGVEKKKGTKKKKAVFKTDFYESPDNFLAIVGLEATAKQICEYPVINFLEIVGSAHPMLVPGRDVIEHFKNVAESVTIIEFSSISFRKDTPNYAKVKWSRYETDFKGILDMEEQRQEREYQKSKKQP